MSKDKELAKQDKKLAVGTMVDLVAGLLAEHAEKVYLVHKKMDGTLAVNLRLSLKHDEGKLALNTSITYASEQVKDHASEVINFEQGELEFNKEASVPIN